MRFGKTYLCVEPRLPANYHSGMRRPEQTAFHREVRETLASAGFRKQTAFPVSKRKQAEAFAKRVETATGVAMDVCETTPIFF